MPTVITKKSTVAAKVPLSTDLQVGELAVNTADKKLYSKHSDNNVIELTPNLSNIPSILHSGTSKVNLVDSDEFAGCTGGVFTPTTWNPADKGAACTLSNGNLTASANYSASVRSVFGASAGKYYFEIVGTADSLVGIGNASAKITGSPPCYPGTDNNGWSVYWLTGNKYHTTNSAYAGNIPTSATVGIYLDMDAGSIGYTVNGVDKGIAFTGITGTIYAMFGGGGSGAADTCTANFGATAFKYTPPTGYTSGFGPLVIQPSGVDLMRVTWSNLKAALKSYFDTIYSTFNPAIPGPIGGTTPSTISVTNATVSGTISSPTGITFGDGTSQTLAAGKIWYTPSTGAFNAGMGGGNITQQIGEELFIYGKASAAITGQTLLQVIVKTGTVGASGVITFAPASSGITDVNLIVGVGTEDIALNAFGRITTYGIVRGINTSGSTYSETWADNDTIWYNPSTGGLTKTKPTSGILVSIGTVISANSGSGSIQVKIQVYTDLTSISTTSLTAAGGTVTASTPVTTVTQTWNNAAVPFTGKLNNITNTASAAASLLEDWQFDGASKFSIRKDGTIRLANGSFSTSGAGLYGATATTTGFAIDYAGGGNQFRIFQNGSTRIYITNEVNITGLAIALQGDTANRAVRLWGQIAGQLDIDNGTTGTYRDLKLRNQIATGSISSGLAAKTADYTVTANDGTLTADSTSAAITFTLEAASGHNRIHSFVKTAGSNTVTIDGNASETIDGSLSVTLVDRMTLQSNGTNWVRIA